MYPLLTQHPSISKFHSIIEFDDGNRAFISDKASLNGTTLNDIKLEPHKKYVMQTGDRIRFGFTDSDYKFINFGLLEDRDKELDKTMAAEAVAQFIEKNKLYEIKQLPRGIAGNPRLGDQSEIEASLNALVEKLETEARLLGQKLELQDQELRRVKSEAEGAAEVRRAVEQDKEVVVYRDGALLQAVCPGEVHTGAAEEILGLRERDRRKKRADRGVV